MALDPVFKNAYIAMLYAEARMRRKVMRALEQQTPISLEEYDVLLVLEESPHRRLKLSELAEQVFYTRSGMTRLIDRLEREGFVRREPNPCSRRETFAVLTDAGLRTREEAWPVMREVIAREFAERLSCDEARAMTEALLKTLEPCAKLIGFERG